MVHYSSASPARVDPHDGFGIINCNLFHRIWGHGIAQGLFQMIPTENGRFHFTIRAPTIPYYSYNKLQLLPDA